MEPITREEYYLAKIAGTYEGNTPEPVTIEEYYLATMAGDYSGNTPQPVTRLQYYMAKVAGVWGGSIPAPVTRLEYYWAAIANGEGTVFPPVTREEHFLVLVADAYSVVLTVVTGNPALLENSKGNRGLESLTLYGKSTQGSTTGAQLFDVSEVLSETWLSTEAPVEENAVGYWTSGYIPVKTGNYICSAKGSSRCWVYDADKNGLRYFANSGGSPIPIKEGEAFIRVTGANTADPQNFMFNEGNTIKPYEPYTGGAPSPSPSYPQEIESAGMDGEIDVEVLGKNLIPFKEIPTSTNKGITITTKSNGIVHFEGTATKAYDSPLISLQGVSLPKGRYRILEPRNDMLLHVVVKKWTGNNIWEYGIAEIEEGDELLYCYFTITDGAYVNADAYVYMQIDNGEILTESDFEPYKPAQKLIIPIPGGLPGIPVSSGGNYTDKDGQQWVADEIDLAKGERVQRIGKTVVDGEKVKFVTSSNSAYWNLPFKISPGIISGSPCTSRYFAKGKFLTNNLYDFIYTTQDKMKSYFDTSEELNAFCVQKNSEGNPLTIYYCIETPIRTPLSPETIAAYKSLKTYSPTTTITNDAGAGMSVGYKKAK